MPYSSSTSGSALTSREEVRKRVPYQERPFPCTYPECQHRFETLKEMQRHKRDDPTHFYCKKCDVDCSDWEDLTKHKVTMGSDWVEGRKTFKEHGEPAHITCEFCGEDFKSLGGRKRHRSDRHQAVQSIDCPGCKAHFELAFSLVAHLESDECRYISKENYDRRAQFKHIRPILMSDPVGVANKAAQNLLPNGGSDTPGLIGNGTEASESGGGVSLLDQEDAGQRGGYEPMQAEVDLLGDPYPYQPSESQQKWPRLPDNGLGDSMRALSLASDQSVQGSRAESAFSVATSRRNGMMVYTEGYPSIGSPTSTRTFDEDDDDTASQATFDSQVTIGSRAVAKPTAWGTGATSKALFPGAKETPMPGDYASHMEAMRKNARQAKDTNLLTAHWWDPSHPDYRVDLFFNQITGHYCCIFPECDFENDSPAAIEDHLLRFHQKTFWICPVCLKRFKTKTAIFSHIESNGACRIKQSKHYHTLIDELSGGLIEAQHMDVPRIYNRAEQSLVLAGEQAPAHGIMDTRFKAPVHEQEKVYQPRW